MRTVGVGANTGNSKSVAELEADNNMLKEANDGARKRITELEKMLSESRKETAELKAQLDESGKEAEELDPLFTESMKASEALR